MENYPFTPFFAAHPLVTVNAALNATATVLLVAGYLLIKRKHEIAHRNVMLAAFGVSVAFLTCYLIYHVGVMQGKSTPFAETGPVRYAYYAILISHIILAATVPFLAAANIYLGLIDSRQRHRRLARWTFPIWLYVSITGVVIYVMLYHLYPPTVPNPIISP
jgi:putative membrane protein